MDRYSYNKGYQDCMNDITLMLHKERHGNIVTGKQIGRASCRERV